MIIKQSVLQTKPQFVLMIYFYLMFWKIVLKFHKRFDAV